MSSTTSKEHFRAAVKPEDADMVEALARASGVFNEDEIRIARELVQENLARGSEASGYHFLFQDGNDGQLEGYACYGPIPATDRRYELYWIAVRKAVQRTKLAARLLKACEEEAREMGGAMLIAETSIKPDYEAANKFYVAQGYMLLGNITDWHADGDGLAIYGKRLV
jgi:GNAT superfamily N-acetyltransferase